MTKITLILLLCLTLGISHEARYVDCSVVSTRVGEATYYTVRTNHGTTTASGIPLSDTKLTAASVIFPVGSRLRVTNLSNNRSTEVIVTDRGPFATNAEGKAIKPLRKHPTRIVDISYAAAKALNMQSRGVAKVKIQQIK